jgi:hypothetical protein
MQSIFIYISIICPTFYKSAIDYITLWLALPPIGDAGAELNPQNDLFWYYFIFDY